MRDEPIHAAEPPCLGEDAPVARKALPLCSGAKALVQRRTYRFELVTCAACRRRVFARPQLLAAMRSALQLELPLNPNQGEQDNAER